MDSIKKLEVIAGNYGSCQIVVRRVVVSMSSTLYHGVSIIICILGIGPVMGRDVYRIKSIVSYRYHKTDAGIISK